MRLDLTQGVIALAAVRLAAFPAAAASGAAARVLDPAVLAWLRAAASSALAGFDDSDTNLDEVTSEAAAPVPVRWLAALHSTMVRFLSNLNLVCVCVCVCVCVYVCMCVCVYVCVNTTFIFRPTTT